MNYINSGESERKMEKLFIGFISLILTHVVGSLLFHNDYYNTLDTIFNLETEKVHKHLHK